MLNYDKPELLGDEWTETELEDCAAMGAREPTYQTGG
jgi:hypothetical protein